MKKHIKAIIDLANNNSKQIIINKIGAAYFNVESTSELKFHRGKNPPKEKGEEIWEATQYEIYKIICDSKKKEPKFFIEELISGDLRELATILFSILVSQLSIPIAIAVPLGALFLKTGIKKFCSTTVKHPKRSLKKILYTHVAK